MFERYTYLVYTLIFCVPAIVILWTRVEFARLMRRDLPRILLAAAIITLYGSALWPLAYRWGCWRYHESKILNINLFGYVFLEDAVWWTLVSFLVASFVSLSTQYEAAGKDIVADELRLLFGRGRPTPPASPTSTPAAPAGRMPSRPPA